MRNDKRTKTQLIEELEMLHIQNKELSGKLKSFYDSSLNVGRYKKVKDSLEEVVGLTEQDKAKAASIISAIGDGVSIQDKNFRVLYQNQAHKDMTGGDKRGGFCYIAYAHNSHICEGCPVEASFKDGEIHGLEKSLPDNRGHIDIKASPLFDSSGNIVAGIEVVRDITHRKQLEEERETLIRELRYALDNIKTLRGLIPICAWCKKIRDDKGYWDKFENYIQLHSHVSFTHGICPDCLEMESPETFQKIKDDPELYNKLIINTDDE